MPSSSSTTRTVFGLWLMGWGKAVLSQAVDTVASRSLTYFAVLTVEGWLAAAACALAVGALVRARRASRRLDRLTESYWELRYEYGELRTRVDRLEARPGGGGPPAARPPPPPP